MRLWGPSGFEMMSDDHPAARAYHRRYGTLTSRHALAAIQQALPAATVEHVFTEDGMHVLAVASERMVHVVVSPGLITVWHGGARTRFSAAEPAAMAEHVAGLLSAS